RMDSDLTRFQIDLLIGAFHDADLQVDDAVLAKRSDDVAILRVEGYEPVTRRHIQDAFVALAVGPIRNAAARELARRIPRAFAFAQAVRPDQLAGFRVKRDHRSAGRPRRAPHRLDPAARPPRLA